MKLGRLLIVTSLGLGWACASNTHTGAPDPAASAGAGGTDVAEQPQEPGRFGASACRTCQADACGAVETDCSSEPACAAFLACVDACPEGEAGGVETECADACPLPESAETRLLARAVTSCRTTGYGAACSCGPRASDAALLRQVCEPSDSLDSCIKCRSERCCESREACLNDEECLAYFSCVGSCESSPAACQLACGSEHPEGWAIGVQVIGCTAVLCRLESECYSKDPDPCDACNNLRCAGPTAAYLGSVTGQRAALCVALCPGVDCPDTCSEPNLEGEALRQDYLGCAIARCLSECTE
jgi:hypothetical protein